MWCREPLQSVFPERLRYIAGSAGEQNILGSQREGSNVCQLLVYLFELSITYRWIVVWIKLANASISFSVPQVPRRSILLRAIYCATELKG